MMLMHNVLSVAVLLTILLNLSKCQQSPEHEVTDHQEVIEQGSNDYGRGSSSERISLSVELFDLLMGRYNSIRQSGGSGVTYIRWGRMSCPMTKGTQLLYTGRAAGSHYTHYGGGANYLCVPNNPQYLPLGNHKGHVSWLYGTEYEATLTGTEEHNVPCSVCYASYRGEKLMIPAYTTCPESWTEEYNGYLMTEKSDHRRNAVYECVDQHAENIPGTQGDNDGALFYHVVGACGAGLPCPPFVKNKVIACVVCTK